MAQSGPPPGGQPLPATLGRPPAANRAAREERQFFAALDYYLSFTNCFGFSLRLERSDCPAAQPEERAPDRGGARLGAASNREQAGPAPAIGACSGWNKRRWRSLLRRAARLAAFSFTAFLSLNHCIVLADYIYQGSTKFMDLLFEVRLVITKLSALVFLLGWLLKEPEVSRLLALVKARSVYIFAGAGAAAVSRSVVSQRRRRLGLKADELRRRVTKWWLMCFAVTLLHFGSSEAEVTSSHHLWQWLHDYSLHQLNNQTTSLSTLLLMASFDNYMYTFHVYGTRLFGVSIICIVFSLQSDAIGALRRQALALTRACEPPPDEPWPLPLPLPLPLTQPLSPPASAASHGTLFVLGLSDWLSVERRARHSAPIGHLSARLAALGRLAGRAANRVTPARLAAPAPKEDLGRRAPERGAARATPGPPSHARIELELEQLAAKYELVRLVAERTDACFGPLLLVQYFSLFLMSCIDLVYFSVGLTPQTKTKYIIISGMVLLWWPYLLVYAHASDINTRSKELLKSVRRLARLAQLRLHSARASGGRPTDAAGRPQPLLPLHYYSSVSPERQLHRCSCLAANAAARSQARPAANWSQQQQVPLGALSLGIMNKLDHVFKPIHISLVELMTFDKFFLLNFARIVITASVMIIQFIS